MSGASRLCFPVYASPPTVDPESSTEEQGQTLEWPAITSPWPSIVEVVVVGVCVCACTHV